MKYLKRTALAFGLLPAFVAAPVSNAASLDVDVDITLPEVVILYGYTDIDLTLNANQLGPLLEASCTSDQCTQNSGATTGNVNAGGNIDLGLDAAVTVNAAGTNPVIRLENSWGVRGVGFNNYDESVSATAGNEVQGLAIQDLGAPSLTLNTGYVEFELNLSDLDPNNDGAVSANYTITVVGS